MTAQEQLVADVKAAIRDSGTRQAWVAERLGISAKHLSQMLTGKVAMRVDWAEQILRLCGMRLALTVEGALPEPLAAAIEGVLFDHSGELDGENVDSELVELAEVYRQLTGWDAVEEMRRDRAMLDAEVCRCGHLHGGHADPDACFVLVDGGRCPCDGFTQAPVRRTEQDGGIPNDAITRTDWDAATREPGETA